LADEEVLTHVATVLVGHGAFVWHVFEEAT
jgi:hypothetical protein